MASNVKILLVDDEARNLDALEAILDEPTYTLLRADEADKALKVLLENDVAAIVLDIKMPGVSGFELARLIKGTKRFRQIPIVFLTAYLIDDEDIVAGYGAGAVDYLTKPVNPQILRHKVAVFADLFRKTRALAELNETLETRVQERTSELERSEAALRAVNKQKDVFLATLAHELRNPLAPLRTGLDMLARELVADPAPQRTLAVMNRQVDHLVRLVDDLLDVSRINRGVLELRKESAEIRVVIEGAIETVNPVLLRRRQTVSVEAPEPVWCNVDPTRIAQVIANLLNNASKHSPLGATIDVRVTREADTVSVSVIDRGVGIPVSQLGRVFEMFTTIERSLGTANDGLGIGLALSRELAELHGGTLMARSDGEHLGATFTLTVPLSSQQRALPDVVVPLPAAEPSTAAGLRIVVVDDNEDAAEMLSEWLQHSGHTVSVARTGPEGLALIVREAPDVVLCDIGLPGMDGVEVCEKVLLSMKKPPLMVALTGWGMELDRRRTEAAGFRHHLVKPARLEEVRAILASAQREALRDTAPH